MLNSDVELLEITGVTLDVLRNQSAEILVQLTPQSAPVESNKPSEIVQWISRFNTPPSLRWVEIWAD